MCSLRVLICSVAACCLGERITTPSRTAKIGCRFGSQPPWTRTGQAPANVFALMAIPIGALPDAETARLAEIVAPGIAAVRRIRLVRAGMTLLRMDIGRRLQRKADLRIGVEVGAAALMVIAGAGDDVAGRAIGEVVRAR